MKELIVGNNLDHFQLTGQKLFVCNICTKECVSAANIIDHLCVHSDERPVACEECGMAFKSEKALKRHLVRHTKKAFVCDSCGALFCSGADLKSHASVHSNKREFICKVCGKGFNHSTTLSRHKQVNNEEKSKHVCHICGATLRRKDHVQRHVSHIHGVDEGARTTKTDGKKWFRNKRVGSASAGRNQMNSSVRRPVLQISKPIEVKEMTNVGTQVLAQFTHVPETAVFWTTYDDNTSHNELNQFYKPGDHANAIVNISDAQHKYTDISKNAPIYSGNSSVAAAQDVQQTQEEMYSGEAEQRKLLQGQTEQMQLLQGHTEQRQLLQGQADQGQLLQGQTEQGQLLQQMPGVYVAQSGSNEEVEIQTYYNSVVSLAGDLCL